MLRATIEIIVTASVILAMNACSGVKLPNNQTAAEQFVSLSGNREKGIAKNFYELGEADSVKRLYWAQRRAQEIGGIAATQPDTGLKRRYVVLPTPEHTEPDGTIKEASNQVVEVVTP